MKCLRGGRPANPSQKKVPDLFSRSPLTTRFDPQPRALLDFVDKPTVAGQLIAPNGSADELVLVIGDLSRNEPLVRRGTRRVVCTQTARNRINIEPIVVAISVCKPRLLPVTAPGIIGRVLAETRAQPLAASGQRWPSLRFAATAPGGHGSSSDTTRIRPRRTAPSTRSNWPGNTRSPPAQQTRPGDCGHAEPRGAGTRG